MQNQNKEYSNDNVKAQKPNVPKTKAPLIGHTGGSFNAGHNSPIHLEYVMAGQKIRSKIWQAKIKLLTPKTPSYQNLYFTQRTFFVPYSAVFQNYEKFMAQKGGASVSKIKEMPNFAGKKLPIIYDNTNGNEENQIKNTVFSNSLFWRDTLLSRFIPRISSYSTQYGSSIIPGSLGVEETIPFKINALPMRAMTLLYNDFLRNKEYEEERIVYKDDEVSEAEWKSYLPNNNMEDVEFLLMRAKLPDSYYTNYRTELQGEEVNTVFDSDPEKALLYWTNTEGLADWVRTQAETANKNDWEIIAELRGTKPALQGKPQLISKKTIPLAYSAVTQNTYNNNEQIQEEFRLLGQQGAYSYTEVNLKLVEYFDPIEDGMLITIGNVWADSVYSTAVQRCDTNVNIEERYRPDLIGQKVDVQYSYESGTDYGTKLNSETGTTVIGFKRKFSELFQGRNMIYGDMTPNGYFLYQTDSSNTNINAKKFKENERTIPNNTFNFYENNRRFYKEEDTGFTLNKKIWKDYSDLMLDKNQAKKSKKIKISTTDPIRQEIVINGDNQIYYLGICITDCDIPVDESIKNDFTNWGEH